jgi:hypothetical protein
MITVVLLTLLRSVSIGRKIIPQSSAEIASSVQHKFFILFSAYLPVQYSSCPVFAPSCKRITSICFLFHRGVAWGQWKRDQRSSVTAGDEVYRWHGYNIKMWYIQDCQLFALALENNEAHTVEIILPAGFLRKVSSIISYSESKGKHC